MPGHFVLFYGGPTALRHNLSYTNFGVELWIFYYHNNANRWANRLIVTKFAWIVARGSATLEKLSNCCLVHFLVNSRLNDVDPKNDFAPQELMKSTTCSLSSDHFPFLCINPLQASAIRSKVISALKIIIPQSVFIEFLIQLMTSYLLHCCELDTALLNNNNAISNWKLPVL